MTPTVASIQRAVAEHYNLRSSDMRSRDRRLIVVRPRMVAMFLSRKLTGRSFPNIGRHFRRDHTTVIHACRAVEHRIATQEATAANVLILRERLGQ